MPPRLHVLYEDNHLLVVCKPAGLATMGLPRGEPTLVEQARAYLKHKYHKPGNVYLGVVSRLDALVSGVVVLARTSKAAARLTEQFRTRQVQKIYWAIVQGALRPPQGACEDHLREDPHRRRVAVAPGGDSQAKPARLTYRTLARLSAGSLLEVHLHTGRKHQIRAQLAARGCPILGDRKYGARQRFIANHLALHAHRLVFRHPVGGEPIDLRCPVPRGWHDFGVRDEPPTRPGA